MSTKPSFVQQSCQSSSRVSQVDQRAQRFEVPVEVHVSAKLKDREVENEGPKTTVKMAQYPVEGQPRFRKSNQYGNNKPLQDSV